MSGKKGSLDSRYLMNLEAEFENSGTVSLSRDDATRKMELEWLRDKKSSVGRQKAVHTSRASATQANMEATFRRLEARRLGVTSSSYRNDAEGRPSGTLPKQNVAANQREADKLYGKDAGRKQEAHYRSMMKAEQGKAPTISGVSLTSRGGPIPAPHTTAKHMAQGPIETGPRGGKFVRSQGGSKQYLSNKKG